MQKVTALGFIVRRGEMTVLAKNMRLEAREKEGEIVNTEDEVMNHMIIKNELMKMERERRVRDIWRVMLLMNTKGRVTV